MIHLGECTAFFGNETMIGMWSFQDSFLECPEHAKQLSFHKAGRGKIYAGVATLSGSTFTIYKG